MYVPPMLGLCGSGAQTQIFMLARQVLYSRRQIFRGPRVPNTNKASIIWLSPHRCVSVPLKHRAISCYTFTQLNRVLRSLSKHPSHSSQKVPETYRFRKAPPWGHKRRRGDSTTSWAVKSPMESSRMNPGSHHTCWAFPSRTCF